MTRTMPWQLWPGRHWPLGPAEEAAFVSQLENRAAAEAARPAPVRRNGVSKVTDRDIITVLVGALRCGSSCDGIFALAPGLRATALLAAYQRIESLRAASEAAWLAIEASPSVMTITEHGPAASRLVPVPVYELAQQCATSSHSSLERTAARMAHRMRELGLQAQAIEADLTTGRLGAEAKVEHSRELYDPYNPGLWANPYFRQSRVGALTPVRLADLLGERSARQ